MVYDYTDQIKEFWPTIMLAWDKHSIERPIIECDLDSAKVIAYPSKEYIENLSERDREQAQEKFDQILNNGGMVVFIRDNKNRVLQSYTFGPDCFGPLP
jgi:hypothetical protein